MLNSWRDYLPEVEAAREARDIRDDRDVSSPIVAIVPNVTANAIEAGILRLKTMRPPSGVDQVAWACAVRDATGLLEAGWAGTALALGWSPLCLFGAVPDPRGDPYGDGLAVWLSGRRVVAITEARAFVVDAHGNRRIYTRPAVLAPPAPGAVVLWKMAGGR